MNAGVFATAINSTPALGDHFIPMGKIPGRPNQNYPILLLPLGMKVIDATQTGWQTQCVQCAQTGKDFLVSGYLVPDLVFLRNVGFFYNFATLETTQAIYFNAVCKTE
jgi:hypothetical protein